MRVTDSMLYDQSSYDIDQAQSRVQSLTEESSSGIAVNHPWDNPSAASLAVSYQIAGARFGAISQEVQSANGELSSADGALTAITNGVQQAIQLAMETGSDVLTAAQRQAAAAQVTSIQNSIVAALNTQVGNRFIFGGTADTSPPFDAAGNYSGNANVRQVEVAPGVLQNASVRMDVAVKGVGGGVDLFSALSALSSALTSNNGAAVIASEANLQTALTQVNLAHTQEGADAAALQTAQTVNQQAQLDQTTNLSNAVDADEITAATQLAQAQTVLQAAINASSKSFQMSLVDVNPSGG